MKTIGIDWSFPTSPNADKFKFKAGCWTVSERIDNDPPKAVAAFATEAEAVNHAHSLGVPFGNFWKKYEAKADNCDACACGPRTLANIDGMALCSACRKEYDAFMVSMSLPLPALGVNPTPSYPDREWEEFSDFAMSHATS